MVTGRRIRASVAAAAIGLAIVAALFAQDLPGEPRLLPPGPAVDEIRRDDIAAHIKFLPDHLLEGRAPSTRGGRSAAAYVAAQLATLGFGPAGDNGTYLQDVAILESMVRPLFSADPAFASPRK